MAAPSATPGNTPAAPKKKEITPDQKKQFAIGGLVTLLLIGAVAANWGSISGGSSSSAPVPVAQPTTATEGVAGANPDESSAGIAPGTTGGGDSASPNASAGGAPGTTVAYAGVNVSRTDPFTPFVIIPEIPEAEPTPIPPVEIPSPESLAPLVIPAPNSRLAQAQQPLNLPGVVIPRMNAEVKAPRDAFPPARQSGAGGASADPEPSYDKRLSGIVISDGVRALLEINGLERKSYVVQPGDTVEGVTILDIQRFDEGGRTITRMLIRENGQQRYVDLKAAPAPLAGEGAATVPGGVRF